jgi:hypothetical protein
LSSPASVHSEMNGHGSRSPQPASVTANAIHHVRRTAPF